MRLVPFEPLPPGRRRVRLRALRDGLIIGGWLGTAFMFLVVVPITLSLGYDAYSYWSIDPADLYGRAMSNNFMLGAFRYAPPIAFLFAPLGLLPWWLFLWSWLALMLAVLAWLGGRWTLVLLALPPVALELNHGNVHLLMAAAVALGFRHPWAWSFAILSKASVGVGLLWFVVRGEWRPLAVAVAVTAGVSIATAVVAPHYWAEFVASILSNLDQPQHFSVPPPLPVRLPLAALLVVWGARTDRPWTVPVAAAMALPILWVHGLTVALAAVPFLRHGDRAAQGDEWLEAARLRPLLLTAGLFLAAALVAALVAGGPLSQLINDTSYNIDPYGRRP
jgi:hypothetical protein